MRTYVIIPAAGVGSRMGAECPKQYLAIDVARRETILQATCRKFVGLPGIDAVIVAVAPQDPYISSVELPGVRVLPVGGPSREETVANALAAVAGELAASDWVMVHDAARPLVDPEDVAHLAEQARREFAAGKVAGAVLGIPVSDTVKRVDDAGIVTEDIARENLIRIATPQMFPMGVLRLALSAHPEHFSDESSAVRAQGLSVAVVPCSPDNFKITTPSDLATARRLYRKEKGMTQIRVGLGYDSHRLEENRKLIIAGVEIPYDKGLAGHSDADVLTHAVIDALLGAANLGNIGLLFPDKDPQWKGADSVKLLKAAWAKIQEQGWELGNLDCVLVAEEPKMNPWLPAMKKNLAAVLAVDESCISIKPKTNEKMGFEGQKLGMSAEAVCLLQRA